MQVSSATNAASSANDSLAGDMGDMFMKLLTAQLKAQDPLSPMDPTAFVGQLVQFNTLGEIMKIRGLLQDLPASQSTIAQSAAAQEQGGVTGGK